MATISVNNTYYMFNVTAANATVGATYTNNGVTYTVKKTIAAGTKLYVTGTAGSTTSGTTLTKTAGTGDATITFSTVEYRAHINGITYVAGDALNVFNDRILDIDESNTIAVGTISANTAGSKSTINVSNSSTTAPIVLNMSTENSDISIVYFTNSLSISGGWLNIATGNGAAGQTLNFNTLMGGAIDSPPAVMVETGDSRHYQITVGGTPGYFMPFFNCGLGTGTNIAPNFDVQAINILTEFYGDLDHGPVFQYDVSTKIATFGNGGVVGTSNGGAVIPNGARVLYPNIHFTSTVYNATQSNRNLLVGSGGATFNINTVAFSRNWSPFPSIANAGDLTVTNAMGHKLTFGAPLIGTTTLTNIVSAPDHSLALASSAYTIQMGSAIGDVYANYLWGVYKTTSTYAPGIQFNNSVSLKQFSNVWGWGSSAVTGCYPVMLESILIQDEAPLSIGPIYNIGGQFYFRELDNIHLTELWNSDTTKAVANTLVGQVVGAIGSKNFSIAKIRKLTNGVAGRGNLITTDAACYQFAVKDFVYDLQSNSNAAIVISGERGYVANINASNPRSAVLSSSTGRKNLRISNAYSNILQANSTALQGNYFEWFMNSASSYQTTIVYDGQPFQPIWTNTSKTTAKLCVVPVSADKLTNRVTVVSGVLGTDFTYSSNNLYVPNAGVEIIYTNEWPTRGITDFSGATATFTHTGFTTNATIEVSLRINDGTDVSTWTSWFDATTASNWQTALASLTGYTSTKGFFARLRLKTTGASSTRVFNFGFVTCSPDSAWVPEEIGFVPILISGQVNGSVVKLYDNTIPASPVGVKAKIITGSPTTLDLPYNFDATAKAFKLKIRKSGYGEFISTDSSYQKGKSAPVSQIQYVSVNDAVVSLYTGISVNGATSTVTVTQNHTILEVYSYCQWWASQVANIDYEIPYVTSDSINFTSNYNLTVSGCTLSGAGNINMPTKTLSVTGGGLTVPIIVYNAGTRVNLVLTGIVANSRVQLYDVTAATELYNAVVAGTTVTVPYVWTTDRSIRYRVMYVSGATAYKWVEATGTVTNTGMNITIAQELDPIYNLMAIDGSTVTECTIVGTTLVINVDDPDNITTAQRLLAFEIYWLSTSGGIRDQNLYIEYADSTHLIFEGGLKIKNLDTVNPLSIIGASIVPTSGNPTDVIDTSGGSININTDRVVSYNDPTKYLTVTKFLGLK